MLRGWITPTFCTSGTPLGILGDAAQHYTELGLHILPLVQDSKRPAVASGVYAATDTPDQIQEWWTANPLRNIGIATGASNLVAYDVDGFLGEASLAILETKYGKLPDTVTQVTPGKIIEGLHTGKGRHLIFKGVPGLQSMVRIADGIDVKAIGGYVVAAPSVHPNGGAYEFASGHSFDDMTPATLPATWIAFLKVMCSQKQDRDYCNHDEELRQERALRQAAEAKATEALERLADTQDRLIAHLEGKLPHHPLQKEAAEF